LDFTDRLPKTRPNLGNYRKYCQLNGYAFHRQTRLELVHLT